MTQNMSSKLKDNLSDVYDTYKRDGLYAVGEKYAEPSVRLGLQAKKDLESVPISDVNKHQYVSCVGSTGGLLSTAETLAGGIYKEGADTWDKITNSAKRKAYGGSWGVLADAKKDLKNDIVGSAIGYTLGKYNFPEGCNILLNNSIKLGE